MATYESNLDGKANIGSGGGGGDDTYTAPNEYFVDGTLAEDATKRQYQTIAAALAAATTASDNPIIIRLAEHQTHTWDGTNLAGAAADVYIYAMNPPRASETTLALQNPTTLSSDNLLSIRNLNLSGTLNVTVGVDNLYLENCSGVWYVTTTDQPGGAGFKNWMLRYCDLSCSVTAGAGENGDGQLDVWDSRILANFDSIWDHSGSSVFWTLRFRKTLIEAIDPDPDAVFVGNSFFVDLGFQDVTFIVYASFTEMVLFSGGSPPTWETSRIIEGILDKGGGGFIFGETSSNMAGLEIEYGGTGYNNRLPIDAPDGTSARTTLQATGTSAGGSGLFGQFIFNADSQQWRSPNNGVILGGVAIGTNSEPTFITTITEGDPMIDVNPTGTGSGSLHTLKGRITADNPTNGDGAIWDSDIILRADSSIAANSVTILSGGTPSAIYEASGGQYTLQTLPAVEVLVVTTPVTGSLSINGTALTATAGTRTPGSDDFDGSLGSNEPIVVVNTGSDEFEIAGDFTDDLSTGTSFTVSGSTGNDGTYTVNFSFFSGGNTVIGVNENITDATVDGSISFDASLSMAAEIAAAINDPANSFAALAQVNRDGRSTVVAIASTTTTMVLGDSSGQLTTDGFGISYVVTRNSGSSNTRLNAEIQLTEGRLF